MSNVNYDDLLATAYKHAKASSELCRSAIIIQTDLNSFGL
jgi:hypothetical protein